MHFACVSASLRRSVLGAGMPDPVVTENGVDIERFEVRPRAARAGVALALGRVCPEKGDKRRSLHYLSGFDPALGRWSPGTLLVGAAIEDAARDGGIELDFLRGQEPYKYAWGAKDRTTWARSIRDGQAA